MGDRTAGGDARRRGYGSSSTAGKARAVGYDRVSSEDQVEGYSLEAQKQGIGALTDRKNFELTRFYSDEGISARFEETERRPALAALLAAAERGEFEVVVVHELSRLARNMSAMLEILKRLAKANVGLVSALEDVDFSTPHGRLFLQQMGAFNEFFSNMLAIHVRKGLRERARQGFLNGDPPFGYRRCSEADGCPTARCAGGVHVVEEEAGALREVFRSYAAGGWTLTDAARWLNDRGFRTRNKVDRGRGSGPQLFTTWSIRDIFRNETYIGRVSWNRGDESFDGLHEAIVDPSIFESVRVTRLRHATKPKTFSRGLRPYLLKGLLRCASCGEAYWAERGGRAGRSYYRGARRGQDCGCKGKMFSTEMLDARVGLLVYSLVLPDDWLQQAKAKIQARTPSMKARRAALEDRRRRIGRAWIDGAVGESEYLHEMAAVAEELTALDSDPATDGQDAVELLDNLEVLWREANLAERSRILSALLEAVYVDDEGHIVGIAPRPAMSAIFAALVTRPETGVTLSPADGRYWWRRGRIELPVQKKNVRDLLQA